MAGLQLYMRHVRGFVSSGKIETAAEFFRQFGYNSVENGVASVWLQAFVEDDRIGVPMKSQRPLIMCEHLSHPYANG